MTPHKAGCRAESQRKIIAAGLTLASAKGYQNVTRADLAAATGLAPATISWHYHTMAQFKRALMRAAVEQRSLRVIAQGLAASDAYAKRAPQELRDAAAKSIRG